MILFDEIDAIRVKVASRAALQKRIYNILQSLQLWQSNDWVKDEYLLDTFRIKRIIVNYNIADLQTPYGLDLVVRVNASDASVMLVYCGLDDESYMTLQSEAIHTFDAGICRTTNFDIVDAIDRGLLKACGLYVAAQDDNWVTNLSEHYFDRRNI